ncbi:MAG: fatty acyl-AMP ligase [Proteobacteria bacterium]|nr:fatty acyl-AMP ligase [Pseudomonadota bacterium]
MSGVTPTTNTRLALKPATFETLTEALDYAAKGQTGTNFYTRTGELGVSLSYGEIRERAVVMARRFIRAGLPAGGRVAIVADTSPDFLCFFYACQYAGLAPVPLPLPMNLGGHDPYVQRIARMIESAGAVAAIAPAEFASFLEEAVAGLPVQMSGTPEDFNALPEDGVDLRPFGKDDLCYIQYSSGSTRFPRGVTISQHAALSNMGSIIRHGLEVRPGDRGVSWLPLYHDMGLVGFALTPMVCQMSMDFIATSDFVRRPLLWPKVLTANGGTLSFGPTLGYDLCSRRALNGSAAAFDLSAWRAAGIGGDMIRPDILERFRDTFACCGFRETAFVASYGLAESTLAVSFAPLDTGIEVDRIDKTQYTLHQRAIPAKGNGSALNARPFAICGRAMPDHQIVIRDDQGAALADREIGIVHIKGPSVMTGYFQDLEMSSQAISEDGWLNTGDMGYMIDGALVITGRIKDLIICHGRNIWPQDIEWALEQLPGVRTGDVAAFSVTGSDGAERVVIVLARRLLDAEVRRKMIRTITATVHAAAGVACEVVLAPPRSLPHTSSGKLSRSAVKSKYLAGGYAVPPAPCGPALIDQTNNRHNNPQSNSRASAAPLAAAD